MLLALPSYSPCWRCPSNNETLIHLLRVMPKTSRVTTCWCGIFSTRIFYGFIPKPLTPPLRPRHSLFIPISFSVLPFPSWYILSPHTSRFIFHRSSFPSLYPALWLLTTTSLKGTSCPHLFFRVEMFERFMLSHHRKPFQVISKLGVRYTGIFDHISQKDQTICLAQGMSLSLL